jgi:hypothetical protein
MRGITTRWSLLPAVLTILGLLGCRRGSSPHIGPAQEFSSPLQTQYDDFAFSLNTERFREGYPALIAKLTATDTNTRITAVRTIGQSGETDAIPLVVDFVLNEEDRTVRIWAGSALEKIVSSNELKRRDPLRPEKVVILPPSHEDIDLRPLAWVCSQMLAEPDDGSTHSYAATMIGYLDLKQFEPDLGVLLKSRHPAVTRSAVNALRMMGFVVESGPHPLKKQYQERKLLERTPNRAVQE